MHHDAFTDEIQRLLGLHDMRAVKKLLLESEEIEILNVFHNLSPEEQVIVFRLLSKSMALEVFEELDTDQQQNLLSSLSDERTLEYINELAPDDRVRLLDEMPAMVAKKFIESLTPEEFKSTYVLLGYEPETAGRIMTTEFISLRRDMTAAQALDKTKKLAAKKEKIGRAHV